METFKMRPRSLSHHLSATKIPSRKWLMIKAQIWRRLMALGMLFHDYAPPKPPPVSFIRDIPTGTHAPIKLYFYTPPDYARRIQSGHKYPVVVNFHGGGFCIGHATDDRYWARVVVAQTDAVVVSVNYRLAPENPFPIPIDDCVDALLYLSSNAANLGIDTKRTALSGFSAGANLAFAAPLRLRNHTQKVYDASQLDLSAQSSSMKSSEYPRSNLLHTAPHRPVTLLRERSKYDVHRWESTSNLLHPSASGGGHESATSHSVTASSNAFSNLHIVSIVAWYPLLDWSISRSQKVRTSAVPNKTLSRTFYNLFDFSYLPPPNSKANKSTRLNRFDPTSAIDDHVSPYASPALAPSAMLQATFADATSIQLFLCEFDMLLHEGQKFAQRLTELKMPVESSVIPGVKHGFDKSPSPFREQSMIDGLYESACTQLRAAFMT